VITAFFVSGCLFLVVKGSNYLLILYFVINPFAFEEVEHLINQLGYWAAYSLNKQLVLAACANYLQIELSITGKK